MSEQDARIAEAQRLAAQAAEAAARLKVGAWESVQGLALSSIAISLAELAGRQGRVTSEG